MHFSTTSFWSIIIVLSISLLSCDKSDMQVDDRALGQIAMEQALQASVAFTNAYSIVDQYARQVEMLNDFTGESPELQEFTCGLLSFSATGGNGFPAVLQLNFSDNCEANNYPSMRGTLKATYAGKLSTLGTRVSLEFIDFTYNNIALEGDYSVLTNRTDSEGIRNYKQDLVSGRLTYQDGSQLRYDETTFIRSVDGNSSDYSTNGVAGIQDDVFEENRTATLMTGDSEIYSLTTAINPRRLASCPKPVSGELRLASSVLTGVATLDFGEGACDDTATIMYEGKESTVQF